jgi:anti-sigma factor (TIGR02949 family)
MNPQDMSCEQALLRLFDFLDHELEAGEREAIQHHLSTCRSCFSRSDFERRLKSKLGELRRERPLADAGERLKRLLESF